MKSTVCNNKYPLVTYPVDSSRVVWFKNSGSFLLMEDSAYNVLQLVVEGKDEAFVKNICRKKYGNSTSDSDAFVDEIIHYINLLNKKKRTGQISKKRYVKQQPVPEIFGKKIYYRFGETVICFEYQDEWLKHMIHPSFTHLKCKNLSSVSHNISCFRIDNILIICHNTKVVEAFEVSDAEYYKGAVSQLIYSIIYKKPFCGWMCTLHASGVHLNNKAIIFSAAAGCGKSTIAAIIKSNGFDYISDDFIAATPNGKVYPFPASISVKNGSFSVLTSYYPELAKKQPVKASTGKMVRYLPVYNFSKSLQHGIPVTGFIFVNYLSESGFSLSEVNKKEALQLLLEETWVNPKAEFVKAFFEWINKIKFYRMTYSDNELMVSNIKKLFEDEG